MEGQKMLSFDDLTAIHPEHLWIKFSASEREEAWQTIFMNSEENSATLHQTFVNYLCLTIFIRWLENEGDLQQNNHQSSTSLNDNQTWKFVNGVELSYNNIHLALIPSEQGSISEFRIPQEWVDIPNWASHYYLALQLNLEDNWLRIWGFISYEQVRLKATYDSIDRTYCLKRGDLIADLNIMWLASELCPRPDPQVQSLPNLSKLQAIEIIETLSKPTVYSPRLSINFSLWGAILASDEYRYILYNKTIQQLPINLKQITQNNVQNLSLWFQNIFDRGWRSVDDLLSVTETRAFKFRSDSVLNQVSVKGAKLIDLGIELESKSVALLIGLLPQIDDKVGIRVQLYPAFGETYLPASMKLTLLSESGKTLQSVESRNYDNYIQLKRFKLPFGKYFGIQVALKDIKIEENFVLERFAYSEL